MNNDATTTDELMMLQLNLNNWGRQMVGITPQILSAIMRMCTDDIDPANARGYCQGAGLPMEAADYLPKFFEYMDAAKSNTLGVETAAAEAVQVEAQGEALPGDLKTCECKRTDSLIAKLVPLLKQMADALEEYSK